MKAHSTTVTLEINGQTHTLTVPNEMTLREMLYEELDLKSVRGSCGIGMCGTCTVLVNGRTISSCLSLAAAADSKQISTVEGLAQGTDLHPIQQAFIDHFAFQCAYCTPGFILSTLALLNENPAAGKEEIQTYLAGNLCRCGSYVNILNAVQASLRPSDA